MLVSWAYVDRDTIIHRLDPRARVLFVVFALLAVGFMPGRGTGIGLWDARLVLVFLLLSLLHIVAARLTWQQTRRFWIVIFVVAVVLSLVTLLTGRGSAGIYDTTSEHNVWANTIQLFGAELSLELSAERISYMFTQILRIMTFASLSITIPYTINPSFYGITFKGLGLGDKLAYAMDMAFRYIPSLGRDFQTTMDAQRARGFELDTGQGVSIFQRVRNFAPLLIPLTVGSVIGGEDITDAMDLRAFGIGKRTWLPNLNYRPADWAYTALGVFLLAATFVIKQAGYGGLWVPPFLLR